MISLSIDGNDVLVEEGTTLLEAAAHAGIRVPSLCYMKGINTVGSCRVCAVEVTGFDRLVAACNTPVAEGMEVFTNSPKVLAARHTNVELILSRHDTRCTTCERNGNCELQRLADDLAIVDMHYEQRACSAPWDKSFPLVRDSARCVKCLRCVQVCDKVQGVHVWNMVNCASRTDVGVHDGAPIELSDCTLCGQCITHCPTGALRARNDTEAVRRALADPDMLCVAQIAPAVRTAWGEGLGIAGDDATVGKLATVLRMMGFDYVFDTAFSADVTIMEEAHEFLERLEKGESGGAPLFTSCCPGWVRFVKSRYPHHVDNLSTVKSPQQIFGAIVKTYYAKLLDVNPSRIFFVSIMPCVAKKHECALPSMDASGVGRDVDAVITTRELDRMIRAANVPLRDVPEGEFDAPLGDASGAGVIFGASGGVMEAALRSAHYFVTGENPDPGAFTDVRSRDGWREASFEIGNTTLRVAVASGLRNVNRLLRAIDAGEASYDFVEMMACPGGCAGGGGQPIGKAAASAYEHGAALYDLDERAELRFSHENPSVLRCYHEFFGEPLSEKAERLLHVDHHEWSMPHR